MASNNKSPEEEYPQYFDLDGAPVRQTASNLIPELFNGSEWVPLWDEVRLGLKGTVIDKKEFARLYKASQAD